MKKGTFKTRLLILPLLVMASCTQKNYSVNGKLASDKYNGVRIYMVPLEPHTPDRVDSTIIEGNRFVFSGHTDTAEIFILRTPPRYRLDLQELLVVREPGNTEVFVGAPSWAKGTALNDSLQKWKSAKMEHDSIANSLIRDFRTETDSLTKLEKKEKIDSLNQVFSGFNYRFALSNKDNLVGKLVTKMAGASFTPEQKAMLQMTP